MRHKQVLFNVGLRVACVALFLLTAIFTAFPPNLVLAESHQKPLLDDSTSQVMINEFHYDNAGGDVGEAIEITGPAGTDLTGWSIELYNGSSTQLNVYETINLSGTLSDSGNGFGYLSITQSGIQNGAPDGLALVDNNSTVIQFISYEGSFTAASGTAAGMTSTDIGVSETSSTPIGSSLQLTGSGCTIADFTWAAPTTSTFGATNTGQTHSCSGTPTDTPPTVSSTTPADSATGVATDSDITINFSEDVTVTGTWFTISCASSGAHTATVTGGPQNYTLNPDTDFGEGELCTVTIIAAQIADQDDTADNMSADHSFNFTTATAAPSNIIINEFLADPASDLTGDANGDGTREGVQDEFVEIVNISGADLNISGWTLSDGYGVRHIFPTDTIIPANCNIVIFGGGTPTGSFGSCLVQTASTGSIGLNNSGDTITVRDGITVQAEASYGSEGGDNQSLTLDPDITGTSYVKHSVSTGSNGALFSPGTKIDGTNFSGCVATNMIINEVDADQTSTDTAEFVELYDGGTGNTALDGLVLVLFNGSDDQSYTPVFDLDGYTTDADGYFVICGNAANVPNCDLDGSPDTNLLQNDAEAVALYVGDATDFPNDTAITTTNLLDAIVYDIDDGDDAGLLVLLNSNEPQVNENGSGDKDNHSNQRCDNGTGGQRNTSTYIQKPPTPGTANSCAVAASIDLELTKTVNNPTPLEGHTVIYTLTVSNVSTNQTATSVVVRDHFPQLNSQVENIIPVCIQGTTTMTTQDAIDWFVGDLAPGASAYCTISMTIAAGTDGTTINNYAEVYSVAEATDNDSTPGNFNTTPVEDDEDVATVTVGIPATCGTDATSISTIQGSGTTSPNSGESHTIEGIVVGDFQTSDHLRGFFVQEEVSDNDGNPATSEGIFIYDGSTPAVDVNVGDIVRVTGTVAEYNDLTELTSISSVQICSSGTTLPAPAIVTLPIDALSTWEQYEGMLITIPQTLYATENYNTGRYGEVALSVGGRLNNPTNVVAPGAAAIALQDLNDRSRIQLEDGSTAQNPDPAPYMGADNTLRAGDTLPGLVGVLHYAYGDYEIHPTGSINFTRTNSRSATPPSVGGTVKVASFNVLNYFTTLDDSGAICGPTGGQDCRGADTAEEFTRQRNKIIAAIVAMDADVIGLMEMENHPTDAALQDLVNGLNAAAGAGTYAFINTGTIGTDAIKLAFIYKPATVSPEGTFAILDSTVDATFIDTKNRPSLAQTFSEIASGETFTVVVNHLKSKGSSCDSIGDPDALDGQGNCNMTRTNAATALANWLATDPTNSGDPDFLIIGDMNAYAMEDPITALTDAGYTNLVSSFIGSSAYSYVFEGQNGYLDHALASADLVPQVTGVAEWHINADEPSALDYNDYNQTALYSPNAFRASDHDPVIIGLSFSGAPTVLLDAKTVPADGSTLTTGPNKLYVEFSKDVKHDGSLQAANNVANYLLVEGNGDGFQTISCAAGVDTADTQITINSVSYSSSNGFVATLSINDGIPLPNGTYRLFICGTTSIEDLDGLELNGGLSDTILNFTVRTAVAALPDTGFTPGVVTEVNGISNLQPLADNSISLVVPKLGVNANIVGVPLTKSGWDVSWLSGQIGYLGGTAYPTWEGNTILTAHAYDNNGLPGLFNNLTALQWGDRIQIEAYGLTYTYQVREIHHWASPTEASAFEHEVLDWITLVTCQGYDPETDTYPYRTVVRAILISVK